MIGAGTLSACRGADQPDHAPEAICARLAAEPTFRIRPLDCWQLWVDVDVTSPLSTLILAQAVLDPPWRMVRFFEQPPPLPEIIPLPHAAPARLRMVRNRPRNPGIVSRSNPPPP